MSQDIAIKEGELSRQFGHIGKLKIAQSGGGDTLWVPEDEVQTNTLHVDKNGVYDAHAGTFTYTKTKTKKTKNGKKKKVKETIVKYDEDYLCYGYDEVNVNIIDSVTGKGSDGNDYSVNVGDDDFLEIEEVPERIEITTYPNRMTFIDGELIDTTGMVVTAYHGDGTVWGEVPLEELTIEPDRADESQVGGGTYTPMGNVKRVLTVLRPEGHPEEDWTNRTQTYLRVSGSSDLRCIAFEKYHVGWVCVMSKEPFTLTYRQEWTSSSTTEETVEATHETRTVGGKEYDYYYLCYGLHNYYTPASSPMVSYYGTFVYGTIRDDSVYDGGDHSFATMRNIYDKTFGDAADDGKQNIKVIWGEYNLETSYGIDVHSAPSGGSSGSGNQGGSGGSSGDSW